MQETGNGKQAHLHNQLHPPCGVRRLQNIWMACVSRRTAALKPSRMSAVQERFHDRTVIQTNLQLTHASNINLFLPSLLSCPLTLRNNPRQMLCRWFSYLIVTFNHDRALHDSHHFNRRNNYRRTSYVTIELGSKILHSIRKLIFFG